MEKHYKNNITVSGISTAVNNFYDDNSAMIADYIKAENALRKRIATLSSEVKSCTSKEEETDLLLRIKTLREELYDIIYVLDTLCYDGGIENCRNA